MTNPEHIYAIDAYADGELDPLAGDGGRKADGAET
jgi:hypothetical protein